MARDYARQAVSSSPNCPDFGLLAVVRCRMVATLSAVDSAAAPSRLTAEEVCRVYAPDVCRFASLMSSSPADAEDVAQDALLRAVRSLGRFVPSRGPIEAWLWRIVSNAAKDA